MRAVDLILALIIAACIGAAILGMIKRTRSKCTDCTVCSKKNCTTKKRQSLKFKLVNSDNKTRS